MERILHCLIGSMNIGGIEEMLMQVYRKIDRDKFQFDFLVHDYKENYFEKEILSLGGKIIRIPYFSRKPIAHVSKFYKIIKRHTEYRIIHIHTTYSIMVTDAITSKLLGRKVIIHSHNNSANLPRAIIHKIFKYPFDLCADYRVACSDLAAKWMFFSKRQDVQIWYNAIDISPYIFNCDEREKIRKKYHMATKKIIGNVGRISYQKNQERLIDIFFEIHKENSDTILLIVGDGEEKGKLQNKCCQLGIEEAVIFAGQQKEVAKYLSAMDIYVCVSRYEGLGISLIEAQINGLPIIAPKEKIPEMVRLTSSYISVDYFESNEYWAKAVSDAELSRYSITDSVEKSLFNIDNWIKEVERFYARICESF